MNKLVHKYAVVSAGSKDCLFDHLPNGHYGLYADNIKDAREYAERALKEGVSGTVAIVQVIATADCEVKIRWSDE